MTVSAVQNVVAGHFGLQVQELKGRSKHTEVAAARAVAMFLVRQLLGLSYPKIGQEFGGRDHSTVMTAVQKIRFRIDNNTRWAATVRAIRAQLEPAVSP